MKNFQKKLSFYHSKVSIIILILFIISIQVSFSQISDLTLTTTRISTGTVTPCSTQQIRCTLTNNTSSSMNFTSISFLSTSISGLTYSIDPTYSTTYTLSGSPNTIQSILPRSIAGGSSLTVVFDVIINCDAILSSCTGSRHCDPQNLLLNFTANAGLSTATSNLRFDINYANLFQNPSLDVGTSPSGLTSSSHLGGIVTRKFAIDHGGSLSTLGYNGTIKISDNVLTICGGLGFTVLSIDLFLRDRRDVTIRTSIPVSSVISGIYTYNSISLPNDWDYIEVEEKVKLTTTGTRCISDCPSNDIRSEINVDWGCAATTCRNFKVNTLIYFDNSLPELILYSSTIPSTAPYCMLANPSSVIVNSSDPRLIRHERILKNNSSTHSIFDINVDLTAQTSFGSFSSEVLRSDWYTITVQDNLGAPIIPSPGTLLVTPLIYNSSSLPPGILLPSCVTSITSGTSFNALSNINIQYPILTAGQSIKVVYYTYRCCPSETNTSQGNFSNEENFDLWRITDKNTLSAGMSECNHVIHINNVASSPPIYSANNTGPQSLHLSQFSNINPLYMTGPSVTPPDHECGADEEFTFRNNHFCENTNATLNRTLFENSLGINKGQLKVILRTDVGLKMNDPTTARLRDTPSPSSVSKTPSIGASIYTLTGGSPGGYYELFWNLADLKDGSTYTIGNYDALVAFLDESMLRLDLRPCCNGGNIVNYSLEWYINTNESPSTCNNCWIPIAINNGLIHLQCPGCKTPGIIVDKCEITRKSLGYIDADNNGIADIPVSLYASSSDVQSNGGDIKSFIQGDILKVKIEASAQDGDNTGGTDYTTLKANWTSPPSPNEFNYINILLKNNCRIAWDLNIQSSSTINITKTLGTSSQTISLPASAVIINAEKLFISVPISLFTLNPHINMLDKYIVDMDINVCGNSTASLCETSVTLWWSGVYHNETAYDHFDLASAINSSLPVGTSSIVRASNLFPNNIYKCEGSGDLNIGIELVKKYNSIWINRADEANAEAISCTKILQNNIQYSLKGMDPYLRNLFRNEMRPIQIPLSTDHFYTPDNLVNPNYNYSGTNIYAVFTEYGTRTHSEHIRIYDNIRSPLGTYTYNSFPTFSNYTLLGSPPSIPLSSYHIADASNYNLSGAQPDLLQGDELSQITLEHLFEPMQCADATHTTTTMQIDGNHVEFELLDCNGTSSIIDQITETGVDQNLVNPTPSLQLILISDPPTIYRVAPTCIKLRLINNSASNILASNAFIHALSSFPTSITILASSSGVIVPTPTGGNIDNIMGLAKGDWVEIEVCFTLNTCNPVPSLDFNFGAGCSASSICISNTINIPTILANVRVVGTSSIVPLTLNHCEPAIITNEYHVTDIGEVTIVNLQVTVPIGTAIPRCNVEIIPTSGGPTITLPVLISDHPTVGRVLTHITYEISVDIASLHLAVLSYRMNHAKIKFKMAFGACTPDIVTIESRLILQNYCYGINPPDTDDDEITFCDINKTITLSAATSACIPVTIESYTIINASCNGAANGSIKLEVRGTTAPFDPLTYSFVQIAPILGTVIVGDVPSGFTSPFIFTGLNPGTYQITIRDMYGCSVTETFTVVADRIFFPATIIGPYTSCDPMDNIIKLTPHIGDNYSLVSWSSSNTSPISGLATLSAGVYPFPVTVIDPSLPTIITVRYTHSGTSCWDEVSWTIYPCCDMGDALGPYVLINNKTLSSMHGSTYEISATGSTTGLINKYRVNGVWTIDDINPIFENCTFFMEPYSEIRIKAGSKLTLNSCVFVACDNVMWKGFNLQSNTSRLVAQRTIPTSDDTRIYDALVGITSIDGADYDLSGVSMNRNWIDIDVKPYTAAIHPSSMELTNLYCHIDAPTEYYGKTLPARDGSLWIPYTSEWSYMGVQLDKVNELNIGDVFDRSFLNTIEDKVWGIKSLNSSLNVNNTDFTNIRCETSVTDFYGTYCTKGGDAILFKDNETIYSPKKLTVLSSGADYINGTDYNQFTNISGRCISMLGKNTYGDIYRNSMNANISIGVYCSENGPTNSLIPYNKITINDNFIHHQKGGIILDLINRSDINIWSNKIIQSGAINWAVNIKISASVVATTNPILAPHYSVFNNRIEDGRWGILIMNIKSPPLLRKPNTLSYNIMNTTNDQDNYIGIHLENCKNTKVDANEITARSIDIDNFTLAKKGIYLNISPTNLLKCNTVSNLYRGFYFNGDCTMPNCIGFNTFNASNIGIVLTGSGRIGDQVDYLGRGTFPANKLIGPFSDKKINNASSATPFVWVWNNARSYFYYLSTDVVNVTRPILESTLTFSDICSAARRLGTDSTEIDSSMQKYSEDIIHEELVFDELYEQGMKEIAEQDIYAMSKYDSTLLDDDSIQAYAASLDEMHTGMVYNLNEELSKNKDSILQDSMQIEASLLAISSTNLVEEKNKELYELISSFSQKDIEEDYSEIQILQLQDIANLCPIKYGQAVFMARAILTSIKGHTNEYWLDDEICLQGIDYRRANPLEKDTTKYIENKIVLYPNPNATGILMFKLENHLKSKCSGINTFKIQNMEGKTIASENYWEPRELGAIDISKYSTGIYTIYFRCSSGYEYQLKFNVIH